MFEVFLLFSLAFLCEPVNIRLKERQNGVGSDLKYKQNKDFNLRKSIKCRAFIQKATNFW